MQENRIPDLEHLLQLQEKTFGSEAPEVAETCLKLADLYFTANNFELAEKFYTRSLERKLSLHDFHKVDVRRIEEQLHLCCKKTQPLPRAVNSSPERQEIPEQMVESPPQAAPSPPVSQESVPVRKTQSDSMEKVDEGIKDVKMELELLESFGNNRSPAAADMLTKLASLYCRKKMYNEMEPLLLQALEIRKSVFGERHPSVATAAKNLAQLYCQQQRYAQAEPLFKVALVIRERVFGHDDMRVADVEKEYAVLLHKSCRQSEALPLEKHVYELTHQSRN